MIKLWKEASNNIDVEIETETEISYLYSGYKITKFKENEKILIYDIRISDFYNEVQGELLQNFIEKGFERCCDELQILKDERRIKIADWYIMKAIWNKDEDKIEKLREDRFNLLKKIENLKQKTYEE